MVRIVLVSWHFWWHITYQLLYIYSIFPDFGLQICPKRVAVDWRHKPRIRSTSSASSWLLLHGTELLTMRDTKQENRSMCYVPISLIRFLKHCCCGKSISITYPGCVFVAFVTQNAKRMRHVVICGLSESAVFIYLPYLFVFWNTVAVINE